MCILFLTVNTHPQPDGYKLIFAANRDEFYARPALPAAPWKENEFVYGGRDMEPGREGGTWLAVGTHGGTIKVGALLNLTGEPKKPDAMGRGPIVSDFVAGEMSNIEYTDKLVSNDVFNSFNLVSVEINDHNSTIIHTSNAPLQNVQLPLNTAYGFGNSSLAMPLEKVNVGLEKFKTIVSGATTERDILIDQITELLSHDEKCWPDAELKRRAPTWGEHLSRIYVKMPEAGYGTRTKTIILVTADNEMNFYESTMSTHDPNGEWLKTHIVRQL